MPACHSSCLLQSKTSCLAASVYTPSLYGTGNTYFFIPCTVPTGISLLSAVRIISRKRGIKIRTLPYGIQTAFRSDKFLDSTEVTGIVSHPTLVGCSSKSVYISQLFTTRGRTSWHADNSAAKLLDHCPPNKVSRRAYLQTEL